MFFIIPILVFIISLLLAGCFFISKEKFKVQFEVMEGHIKVADQLVAKNKTATQPNLDSVLPSYAKVTEYQLNDEKWDFNTPVTGAITLTAVMKYDYSDVLVLDDNIVDPVVYVDSVKASFKDKLLFFPNEIGYNKRLIIKSNAFEGCSTIEKIVFSKYNRFNIESFKDCTNLKEVVFPKELPYMILSIPARAFQGCTSLNKVTIPEDIITIEESAFENTALVKLEHYTLTTIEQNAFKNCKSLTEVILPKIEKIKNGAFSVDDSNNLAESFTLKFAPLKKSTLKLIGEKAFYGRNNLKGELELNISDEKLYNCGNFAFGNTGVTKITCFSTSVKEKAPSGFQEFWNNKSESDIEKITVEFKTLS